MAKILLTIFFFSFLVCTAQTNDDISEQNSNPTMLDSTSVVVDDFSKVQDTTIFKAVFDHEHAASFDKKWLEDLYSNSLYDVMY